MTKRSPAQHWKALALAGAFALLGALQTGCFTVNVLGGGREDLVETVVEGEGGPKIALIEIDGMISEADDPSIVGLGRESTVARVREQLRRAGRDPEVCALLLRIDTPGGTATASELVFSEIARFKKTKNVPVVAQLMGTATSGGYYVAMSADEVVAHPTTVTGSIGVLFVGLDLSGLLDKIGVRNQTITGGVHKDAGSPLRPMTLDERTHLQSVIDELHARFREVVGQGRPKLSREQIEQASDGRIFSAKQALALGLVDRIGSLEDSIARVEERAGVSQTRVVRYHRPQEWRRSMYAEAPVPAPAVNIDLGSFLGPLKRPAFLYLWWP